MIPTISWCAVTTRTVSLENSLGIEETSQRSTTSPEVERQRGKEHGGKAGDEEKTLKS